jgi:hypothetical protein
LHAPWFFCFRRSCIGHSRWRTRYLIGDWRRIGWLWTDWNLIRRRRNSI